MNPQNAKKFTARPLLAFAAGLLLAGCETDLGGLPPAPGQVVTRTGGGTKRSEAVPSTTVPRGKAWRDAEALASREPGRVPLVGGGESMNPVYGDNTMLVIKPVPYEQLQVGMTVVYVNSAGRRISHVLIARERRGWRSKGLNNIDDDPELVTPLNYVGVVYISLAAEQPMVIP